MLEKILKTNVNVVNTSTQVRKHPTIKELMHRDKWCRNLYEGRWADYGYPSRSEAELACVRELVYHGFTDAEIDEVMRHCGIGKWRTAGRRYKELTIKKAREWVASRRR